jgi:hypothetical protein
VWYDDVGVLARRWSEFFPSPEHTHAERVNALVRLVAYATLATFVYNRSPRTLVMGAGIIALVSFVFSRGAQGTETFPKPSATLTTLSENATCTPPTKNNPFANVLLTDLGAAKERPPACQYDSVKDSITTFFNDGLFRNAADVYGRENSQRQFYTMPSTRRVPDTGAFAKFLYGDMKTCKQDQAHCPPLM